MNILAPSHWPDLWICFTVLHQYARCIKIWSLVHTHTLTLSPLPIFSNKYFCPRFSPLRLLSHWPEPFFLHLLEQRKPYTMFGSSSNLFSLAKMKCKYFCCHRRKNCVQKSTLVLRKGTVSQSSLSQRFLEKYTQHVTKKDNSQKYDDSWNCIWIRVKESTESRGL